MRSPLEFTGDLEARLMIRRAFTMRLKEGAFDQYKGHHDNIWPELVREIETSGIGSITTFRSGDNLFLISEIADEGAWDRLWHSDIHRRWAEVMDPLMFLKPDGLVDFGELTEIFHVTTGAGGGGGSIAPRHKPAARRPAPAGFRE